MSYRASQVLSHCSAQHPRITCWIWTHKFCQNPHSQSYALFRSWPKEHRTRKAPEGSSTASSQCVITSDIYFLKVVRFNLQFRQAVCSPYTSWTSVPEPQNWNGQKSSSKAQPIFIQGQLIHFSFHVLTLFFSLNTPFASFDFTPLDLLMEINHFSFSDFFSQMKQIKLFQTDDLLLLIAHLYVFDRFFFSFSLQSIRIVHMLYLRYFQYGKLNFI